MADKAVQKFVGFKFALSLTFVGFSTDFEIWPES